ncbi:MAG: hypothetical protein MJ088_04745 [Clostridia bacterium]|nr:hypothetical protein [Clostridia bacterium]
MRILLSGIGGHMGQEVIRLAAAGCRGAGDRLGRGCHGNGRRNDPDRVLL